MRIKTLLLVLATTSGGIFIVQSSYDAPDTTKLVNDTTQSKVSAQSDNPNDGTILDTIDNPLAKAIQQMKQAPAVSQHTDDLHQPRDILSNINHPEETTVLITSERRLDIEIKKINSSFELKNQILDEKQDSEINYDEESGNKKLLQARQQLFLEQQTALFDINLTHITQGHDDDVISAIETAGALAIDLGKTEELLASLDIASLDDDPAIAKAAKQLAKGLRNYQRSGDTASPHDIYTQNQALFDDDFNLKPTASSISMQDKMKQENNASGGSREQRQSVSDAMVRQIKKNFEDLQQQATYDSSPDNRRNALNSLAQYPVKGTYETYKSALLDNDEDNRYLVVETLSRLHADDKAHTQQITELLEMAKLDDDKRVAALAQSTLNSTTAEETVQDNTLHDMPDEEIVN